MVIGLLQAAFLGQVVGIVLVWRIARRVPARRQHLDDQQVRRRFTLGQDVADEAFVEAFAARETLHRARLQQPRRQAAATGCAGNTDFHVGVRVECHILATRQIERVWRAFVEHTLALADLAPYRLASANANHAAQNHDACFVGCGEMDGELMLARDTIGGKAHIFPASRLRRDFDNLAAVTTGFDQ